MIARLVSNAIYTASDLEPARSKWPAGLPDRLATLFQSEEVILPDPIGIGLNELIAVHTSPDTDPSSISTFIRIESVGALLDEPHDIWDGLLPAPVDVWLWSTCMCDVLVRAVAIRFINAVDSVVSHGCHPFVDFCDPSEAPGH